MNNKKSKARPGSTQGRLSNRLRYDPTANVLDLVEKETGRQDDLREWMARYYDAKIDAMQDVAILRAKHSEELGCVREKHAHELRKSEAARVDSIRLVDIGNFTSTIRELRDSIKQISDLQGITATTLQSRVDTTAQNLAKAGTEQAGQLTERIAALELGAAEGSGKQKVTDPATEKLTAAVSALVTAQSKDTGWSGGIAWIIGLIVGGAGFIFTVMGIAAVLYAVLNK